MRRALVITNADAGSNDERSVSQAVEVLRSGGIETDVEATADEDELARVLADLDGRELVVAGGDGSLHALMSVLHETGELSDAVVGLIPLGTGNDFARGVGIPLDPSEAATVIVEGGPRPIDLLVDDEHSLVVNAVHAGIGADAGREAQPLKPKLGRLGYAVGALLAGVKAQGHKLRVEADGKVLASGERRVLQVGVGNGVYVGGGTPLTPGADPSDGMVDVVVSFAVAPMERLRYAIRLKRGTHSADDAVLTGRASTVRISGEEFWCNADGELKGPFTQRTWRVLPHACTLIVRR